MEQTNSITAYWGNDAKSANAVEKALKATMPPTLSINRNDTISGIEIYISGYTSPTDKLIINRIVIAILSVVD